MKISLLLAFLTISLFSITSFQTPEKEIVELKMSLSEYGIFQGNIADQKPIESVIPYSLNTPLFSDYAEKLRFIQLPKDSVVAYNSNEVLAFPVGTTIIKTFYFPNDLRKLENGRKLIETRLLIHEKTGWKALEYVWNEEQTDAFLEVAGETKQINYVDANGKKQSHSYSIPNLNQCKGCHNRSEKMMPIGPSVRQLNGEFNYGEITENQLVHWNKLNKIRDLPDLKDMPKAPVWNNPESGNLDERARIYLDINCAHCHNPKGPAMTSGLNLGIDETNETAVGINKSPVAAGRGSGNREFDIVKGQPDKSILIYRMESTDSGEMMPEVGRKRTHKEGVALVREWIKNMK